jgi:phosphoglucomutase
MDDPLLNDALLDKALDGLILSVSGWRGVFAADGDGESAAADIAPVHGVILAAAALVFAERLARDLPSGAAPVVVVGMDTRPTGPAMAEAVMRSLLASGLVVRFAGITAAPELMAFARSGTVSGFVYISASHNPIGHNGLKFGFNDGGVLPSSEATPLIEAFRRRMGERDRIAAMTGLLNRACAGALKEVYAASEQVKREAYAAYLDFTREIAAGTPSAGENILEHISRGLAERLLSAAVDFNGSARTVSIDRELLAGLGVKLYAMNDKPGHIAHRIVPEGESLEPCRLFLEQVHSADPSTMLGYVPDCDGDRGNLVVWDERGQKARSLEAQEVFALACVSELAHLAWTGELRYDGKGNAIDKVAVAVNDPTSLRVDRIAGAFGVPVFRAEVGEANVVGLARRLREQGYTVRILGEGSAGGNITHPSAVRDPVNTMLSLIKLLAIRDPGEGFFELWLRRSGRAEAYRRDFSLGDIIASLPAFVSTGTYSPEALLQVRTADHGLLKSRYQRIFLREWEARKEALRSRYGITGWEADAYIGMEELRGIVDFSVVGRGGLKISFVNGEGRRTACIWMRGSGTEPVFRIMADVEGANTDAERFFIEWQRCMVSEADN